MGAGFLFGFGYGFLTAWVGCIIAAVPPFYLSKKLLYERMRKKFDGFKYLRIVNASMESNANKWNALKLVLLMRLPPLFPYPVINYAFGLTKVKFAIYLIGSAIGIAPAVAIDAYLGSLFQSLAQAGLPCNCRRADAAQVQSGSHPTWYIAVVLGVTLVLTVLISWEVKRMLRKVVVRVYAVIAVGDAWQAQLREERRIARRLRRHLSRATPDVEAIPMHNAASFGAGTYLDLRDDVSGDVDLIPAL